MRKVKWLTWCLMYGGCLMVTLKPCDEFKVYWELKGEERASFQLLSPIFLSSHLGPWCRMQGKPGMVYLQPQAQFTVMAEMNRVTPACDLAKPVLSHGAFLSECPSQGPIKGFYHWDWLLLKLSELLPSVAVKQWHIFSLSNPAILCGFKKKKYICLCMCCLYFFVCVFSDTRGDLCFGLIYKWLYQ